MRIVGSLPRGELVVVTIGSFLRRSGAQKKSPSTNKASNAHTHHGMPLCGERGGAGNIGRRRSGSRRRSSGIGSSRGTGRCDSTHAGGGAGTRDVDVMHEELHISYEAGDETEMLGVEPATFSILLRAEDVEIVKHVRVVEEIFVSKKRVTEQKRFAVTLRLESLDVLDAN